MSEGSARTLVFVSGGVLVGLALLSGSGDMYKRVWAAGLWTTLLAVVADLAPQVVGPFALLVIVAAVAVDQGALGKFVAGSSDAAASSAPVTKKNAATVNAGAAGAGQAARNAAAGVGF